MLFAKGKGMAENFEMLTCLASTKAIFAFYGQCGNRLKNGKFPKVIFFGVLVSIHMPASSYYQFLSFPCPAVKIAINLNYVFVAKTICTVYIIPHMLAFSG
jgi:hypothetical protein